MNYEIRELRGNIIDLILLNGDKNLIKKMEREAEMNFGFKADNGKDIKRKKGESLGSFVERYTVVLEKNFSRKKYEAFKALCNEYNTVGDSKIVEEKEHFKIKQEKAFSKLTLAIEEFIEGIFKKPRKRIV